jgi:MoxR-like ATPase
MSEVLESAKQELEQFRTDYERLKVEIGKVIVGHDQVVDASITALIAGGHVLLEGVPGLGKTRLVRTLADCLHMQFQRIQFTPDLMPADLIGTNVVIETAEGGKKFQFERGPVFANVLLADEINRATPKTQSALLEAMQEHTVTVAGQTYKLPEPFFVMATQNPLEMEGTYPLPEAQLDRFLFKLLVSFPDCAQIESILNRTTQVNEPEVESLFDASRIIEMGQLARQITIADDVRRYGVALVLATHPNHAWAPDTVNRYVRYGASPRGAQSLILAGKIRAILDQRYHVARDDLRAAAHAALRHRLILNFEGQAENVRPDQVIDSVLESVSDNPSTSE